MYQWHADMHLKALHAVVISNGIYQFVTLIDFPRQWVLCRCPKQLTILAYCRSIFLGRTWVFLFYSPYHSMGVFASRWIIPYTFVKLQLLVNQLEPLTEQQLMGLSNLQQSSQQAEDALSQGMEALQQSLAETLAGSLGPSGSSGNVANYMGQMAMAMGKLGTLENFLRQVNFLINPVKHLVLLGFCFWLIGRSCHLIWYIFPAFKKYVCSSWCF